MTRRAFIERIRRQIYGGQPSDDSNIGINLVNNWLSDAIGVAAKTNYKDNIALEGVGFVNNSFYSRFKGLTISSDGNFIWKMNLPEVPVGIGANQGISTLQLVDSSGNITNPFIPLSENQRTYFQSMRPIPNKVLYYYEGNLLYIISTLLLNQYTVNITMVSGGDSTNLDNNLNVPPDYFPVMTEYLKQQFTYALNVKTDRANDGEDVNPTA